MNKVLFKRTFPSRVCSMAFHHPSMSRADTHQYSTKVVLRSYDLSTYVSYQSSATACPAPGVAGAAAPAHAFVLATALAGGWRRMRGSAELQSLLASLKPRVSRCADASRVSLLTAS
jgi:hypothetical protein